MYFNRAYPTPDNRDYRDRPFWRIEETAAGTDPMTLEQAKAYLRVFDAREDDLIAGHLAGAIQDAENYAQRTFRAGVVRELRLETWPQRLLLPRPPLITVDKVEYYTPDGDLEELAADEYQAIKSTDAKGLLAFSRTFGQPSLDADRQFPIVITYTSGEQTPPAAALEAMKAKLTVLYDDDNDPKVLERYEKMFESLLDGLPGQGYA